MDEKKGLDFKINDVNRRKYSYYKLATKDLLHLEFLKDFKDILYFLTITFGLIALITPLSMYSYHNSGNMDGITLIMMFTPAMTAMLVAKLNKTNEYPRFIFNYYLIGSSFLIFYLIIAVVYNLKIDLNSTLVNTLIFGKPLEINWFSLALTIFNFSFIFLIYRGKNEKILNDWKFAGVNLRKIFQYSFYFIVIKNLIILLVKGLVLDFDYLLITVLDIKFWLGEMLLIVYSISSIIIFFGEEYGWRFFLQPKLQHKFGRKKGVFALGIIWGVWHIPLLLFYYSTLGNFLYSTIFQVLSCVFLSIIFAYFYEKSGSIWCVAVLHFINNGIAGLIAISKNQNVFSSYNSFNLKEMLISICVLVIISLFFLRTNVFSKK